MKSLNAFNRLSRGPNRDIVGLDSRNAGGRFRSRVDGSFGCRIVFIRQVWGFEDILNCAVGPHQNEISDNHSRIGDVEVGALTYRFFHPICQIPKCLRDTFAGHGQYRTNSGLANNDIYVLCFQAAEQNLLAGAACVRIERNHVPARNNKWWARRDFIRVKTALKGEPARYMPMQWLYMPSTLCPAHVRREEPERLSPA
jgi:hypothetical protein